MKLKTSRLQLLPLLTAVLAPSAAAHHGVASLGAAGLEGPGAPIETSSSATLPEGSWLLYAKADHARFERGRVTPQEEATDSTFWMAGLGYGFTPWLSGYLFAPYHDKRFDTGADSAGLADLSLTGVLGFKYDRGLRLVPAHESLDDLEEWHFTLYLGATLPTGDADHRVRGAIDPGKALGFGAPSYTVGFTATRQLDERLTGVWEISHLRFDEHRYADGQTMRFGAETRLNGALSYRLSQGAGSRWDLNLEANYLALGKDRADGADDPGSGGQLLYLLPGVRYSVDNLSLGLGLKRPVWSDLNREAEQQGAEGTEEYRLILTASALF